MNSVPSDVDTVPELENDVPTVGTFSDNDSSNPDIQPLPRPSLIRFQNSAEKLRKELQLFLAGSRLLPNRPPRFLRHHQY